MEPPPRRRDGALARTRMAAAGVRPEPARMIFAPVALLQQEAALVVDHEDRERAVQEPAAMHGLLAAGADRAVAFVDQDQLLVGHQRGALSFSALALRRSIRLARSTTKRVWVPALIGSSSSLAATSNTTLRPSTETTRAVISTVLPMRVAARCLRATSTPTE